MTKPKPGAITSVSVGPNTYVNKKKGQYDWYDLEVESDSTYGNPHELVYDCVGEAMHIKANIEHI